MENAESLEVTNSLTVDKLSSCEDLHREGHGERRHQDVGDCESNYENVGNGTQTVISVHCPTNQKVPQYR